MVCGKLSVKKLMTKYTVSGLGKLKFYVDGIALLLRI